MTHAIGALACIVMFVTSALAQELSVVIVAAGYDEQTTFQSQALRDAVRSELLPHTMLAVMEPDAIAPTQLRAEISEASMLAQAEKLGATGTAVVQFQPLESGSTAGYAHLWVSRVDGEGFRRVERVLDIRSERREIAIKFAASIVSGVSSARYHLVEFHVFVKPRGAMFSVAGGPTITADNNGTDPDEGHERWRGLREAGVTEVRVFMAGYHDHVERVMLPQSGSEPFMIPIVVELMK